MNWQKGQSVVEFALVIPFFLILVFGVIYSGLAYADYIQYNNAARDAARDIAVQTDTNERRRLADGLSSASHDVLGRYVNPMTSLYGATFQVSWVNDAGANAASPDDAVAVTVQASFVRQTEVSFLPQTLPTVHYTMRLEGDGHLGSTGTDS